MAGGHTDDDCGSGRDSTLTLTSFVLALGGIVATCFILVAGLTFLVNTCIRFILYIDGRQEKS